jgi:hypothetical protein
MLGMSAKGGYSAATQRIDFDRSDFLWRPHFATLLLAIAAVVIFHEAHAIVGQLLPLARKLDPSGNIASPDLLLRPFYSLAFILATVAALKLALTHLDGRTLVGTALTGTAARINVAISMAFVGAFSCFFLYALLHPPVYARFFAEDGPFEDLTAIAFFACCLMYAIAFRRYLVQPERFSLVALVMLFCAFLSLFLALEEVSYGQRIFGWATPAVLEDNLQHESNLHNLLTYGARDFIEWLLICGIFATLCALACLKIVWPRRWLRFAPDDSLLPLSAMLVVVSSHGVAQEVNENSAALFAFLYAVQLLRLTGSNGVSTGNIEKIASASK